MSDDKKLSFLKVMDYITERRKILEACGMSYSAYGWEWKLFLDRVEDGKFDLDEIKGRL